MKLVAACALGWAAAKDGWHVEQGMNACNTPEQRGGCDHAVDSPGFHFVGTLDNSTACAETCQSATSKDCPIWLWSSGSKHCWWRTDSVWNPVKASQVVSACRDGSDGHTDDCVPGCGDCQVPVPTPPAPPPLPPFVPTDLPNMNGEYILSQTPHGKDTQKKFPTHYKDYPGGVMSFDVLSPEFSTLYSQVWWSGLDPVPLPDDVIQRYAGGNAMAVVGFELDQVRILPDGSEMSVPLTVAYNHHFESTLAGGNSRHKKITLTGSDDPQIEKYGLAMGHSMYFAPGSEHWVVEEDTSNSGIPTKTAFGGANGGEVRKSFHGYAPGFAQVIQSPKTFQITPMQIDTWNRDEMPLTSPSPFVAGPLPRTSLAAANASYSGLLECPVTTRIRKDIDGDYMAVISGECGDAKIQSPAECFQSASKTLAFSSHKVKVINTTVTDSSQPPACSMAASADGETVTVTFNQASDSTVQCGASVTRRAGVTASLVTLGVALDFSKDEASISITGPSDVWFGVGFNASKMSDAPWAIIVDGNGDVTERKLQDQNPGDELANSVTVVSNSVEGGLRTVVMTRPTKGQTPDHFTFSADQDVVLPFINAIGSTAGLSYHKDKTPSTLALLPSDGSPESSACFCAKDPPKFGDASGTLNYMPTDQAGEKGHASTIKFDNKCYPAPRTDLLEMKNPTCDIRTYVGGQIACHHMFSLLDADQEIPWADQPLKYHLKFRFWYQDYNASYHNNVKRSTWGIASLVEYDVPKCAADIQGCELDSNGDWIHTIRGTYTGNDYMVAAHFHCHAPTCQSIKMYRDWNGTHGELMCEERPVYGGTGQVDQQKYDEPGFILQPPCLWGSAEQGLEPPPDVRGRTLHTVKTSYANEGHHGEMAWQQMYLVTSLKDAETQIFV